MVTLTGNRNSDDAKAMEMMIFIANEAKDDPSFGAIKFNKLMYYADVLYYRATLKSITGQRYTHEENGPVLQMNPKFTDKLRKDGSLEIEPSEFHGYPQQRPIAKRPADLTVFEPSEIDHIREVVRDNWGLTATQLSKQTHGEFGYLLTEMKEAIPYNLVFLSDKKLTPEEYQRGTQLVNEGW